MQDLLHKILAKHTNQSPEKIADDFDRDFFMDAKSAVEYGIVDEVLTPEELEEQTKAEDSDETEE